jgi:hypothetical protein
MASSTSTSPGVVSRRAVHAVPGADEASGARRAAVVANLGLRFLLELGAYAALAYWGVSTGSSPAGRVALAIAAPLSAVTVWSLFLAPKAKRHWDEPSALVLELVIFATAAIALAATGSAVLPTLLGVAAAGNACVLRALPRGPEPGADGRAAEPR